MVTNNNKMSSSPCEKNTRVLMNRVMEKLEDHTFHYWKDYNEMRENQFYERYLQQHARARSFSFPTHLLTSPDVPQQNFRACPFCKDTVICTPTQEYISRRMDVGMSGVCAECFESDVVGADGDEDIVNPPNGQ